MKMPLPGTAAIPNKRLDADVSDEDGEEPFGGRSAEDMSTTLAILSKLGVDLEGLQYTNSNPASRKSSFSLPPRPGSSLKDPSYMGPKMKRPPLLQPISPPQSRRPRSRQSRPGSALSFVERMHADVMSRRDFTEPSQIDQSSRGDGSFQVPVIRPGSCIGDPPQPYPTKERKRPTSPYSLSRPVSAVPFTADTPAIHPPRCVPTRTTAQAPCTPPCDRAVMTPDVLHRMPFNLRPASRARSAAPSVGVAAQVQSKPTLPIGELDGAMLRWLRGGQLRIGA